MDLIKKKCAGADHNSDLFLHTFSKFIPRHLFQADITEVVFALVLAFLIPARAAVSNASLIGQLVRR